MIKKNQNTEYIIFVKKKVLFSISDSIKICGLIDQIIFILSFIQNTTRSLQLMTEILRGIRVVKLYAWEDTFQTKIEKLRSAELKSLKGRKYLDAMCVYFWATTPVLISILTFTTYSLLGNTLTAAKVQLK